MTHTFTNSRMLTDADYTAIKNHITTGFAKVFITGVLLVILIENLHVLLSVNSKAIRPNHHEHITF